jgi:hypothetical protein
MSGTIPPLPNAPSWRGALLQHSNNFTLFALLCINYNNDHTTQCNSFRVNDIFIKKRYETKNVQVFISSSNGLEELSSISVKCL